MGGVIVSCLCGGLVGLKVAVLSCFVCGGWLLGSRTPIYKRDVCVVPRAGTGAFHWSWRGGGAALETATAGCVPGVKGLEP